MKKIALITTDIPSPTGSGYKMRCFYVAKALATYFKIDLFSLTEKDIKKDETENLNFINEITAIKYNPKERNMFFWAMKRFLRSLFSTKPLGVFRTYNQNLAKKIADLCKKNNYDIVFAEGIWMAQYLAFFPKAIKVIDNHNIETELYKRDFKLMPPGFIKIAKWIDWLKLKRYESIKNIQSNFSLVTSKQDSAIMQEMTKEEDKIKVIPNFIDINFYQKKYQNPIGSKYILFAGLLSYFPNEDGIIWFGQNVWPEIKKIFPEIKLVIVGANPGKRIKRLFSNDKKVVITGYVDMVEQYRQNAVLEIVPLRMGGGTRFKIIEALAMGIPVVSTTIGAEGLDLEDKDIITADKPKIFAGEVIKLLKNDDLRKEMSLRGKKIIEEQYNFNKISLDIRKIFIDLL